MAEPPPSCFIAYCHSHLRKTLGETAMWLRQRCKRNANVRVGD
jgi:hypothetical protein